jgi:hypothetical protein
MADIEIDIYSTEALRNTCQLNGKSGDYSAYVARTFIGGALDATAYTYDIDVVTGTYPDPPDERITADQYEPSGVCGNSSSKTYNTLRAWWLNLLDASCGPSKNADDVNLLLSAANGGGLAAGEVAVCSAGKLWDVPNYYRRFGFDDQKWNQVDSVLEEVGHCLIQNMVDHDGDGSSHDSGMVVKDTSTGRYGISPIGIKDIENYGGYTRNNCYAPYDMFQTDTDGDRKPDGWIYEYSSCSEDYFTI